MTDRTPSVYTLYYRLNKTAQNYPDHPAYFTKINNQWQPVSWQEFKNSTESIARSLLKLNLKKGDKIAILSENRLEWIQLTVAAMIVGIVPLGVYTTSNLEEMSHIINHSDAEVLFYSQGFSESLKKIENLSENLKRINMDKNWQEFLLDKVNIEEFFEAMESVAENDLAILVYTSGTSGRSKAVMLTQKNLVFSAEVGVNLLNLNENDHQICFLPLAHIAGNQIAITAAIIAAYSTYFNKSILSLNKDLLNIRPTLFLSVPRLWERIEKRLKQLTRESRGIERLLMKKARQVAFSRNLLHHSNKKVPVLLELQYKLFDRLIYQKIHKKIGLDQARYIISGAAGLPLKTQEYFLSLNIPVAELYGMSECSGPVTWNDQKNFQLGKSGYVPEKTQLKIADDGEILVKGDHVFSGYYKDPQSTRQALIDSWLYTGDLGQLENNQLKITGRKKDIIVLSSGENISPQYVETAIIRIFGISHAVVAGDGKKHLVALLFSSEDELEQLKLASDSEASTIQELADCNKVRNYLNIQIKKINENLSSLEKIRSFQLLPYFLTVEEDYLTATLKVKRFKVLAQEQQLIENLYIN